MWFVETDFLAISVAENCKVAPQRVNVNCRKHTTDVAVLAVVNVSLLIVEIAFTVFIVSAKQHTRLHKVNPHISMMTKCTVLEHYTNPSIDIIS